MMIDNKTPTRPRILHSCYHEITRNVESYVANHTICLVQEGTLIFQLPDRKVSFGVGEAFFVRRHSLAKTTKCPAPGGEFRSISISFDQDTLKDISIAKTLKTDGSAYALPLVTTLKADRLLKSYFESVSAYEQESGNTSLVRLKVEEGILLLMDRRPELKDILFDFSEPGKIDLEEFMNKHYKFNVEMKRFATLTGRSLATFKRDFEKTFHTSPMRWLQKKRLEEARYLIKEKGMRSVDVYLEVGFEDLSHFSFAFKKNFGVSPSFI